MRIIGKHQGADISSEVDSFIPRNAHFSHTIGRVFLYMICCCSPDKAFIDNSKDTIHSLHDLSKYLVFYSSQPQHVEASVCLFTQLEPMCQAPLMHKAKVRTLLIYTECRSVFKVWLCPIILWCITGIFRLSFRQIILDRDFLLF